MFYYFTVINYDLDILTPLHLTTNISKVGRFLFVVVCVEERAEKSLVLS